MTHYKITPLSVSDKEAFTEASREELRALIAIIECGGLVESTEALAAAAKISRARASSSLVLWEEAGVIAPISSVPSITEEFEARLAAGEIEETAALDTAKAIRSSGLADMIRDFAALLGRATLNTQEIKKLTALHEQYSLSPEYILILAAHMAEKGKLSVSRLIDKAIGLSEKEIDTPRTLEDYISTQASDSEAERAFRKIFGITSRAPSKSEKEAFIRWSREYGYFTDIVGEAYDIAVTKATRGYVAYADKILTHWYEEGCRTLTECKTKHEAEAAEKRAAAKEKTQKTKPKKERYGNFDINDAFAKALERSYGKKD